MKKTVRTLYSAFLYQLNLKQKLLFSYLLLIVLPLMLLTFFSYSHISKTLTQQFQYSSEQTLLQTDIYLNKIMSEITDSTDQIAFNRILSDIFKNHTSDASIINVYNDYLTASSLTKSFFTSDVLYSVELYVIGNPLYVSSESKGEKGISFISLESDSAKELDELLSECKKKILYLPPHTITSQSSKTETTVISCARYLKDTYSYSNMGILNVNLKQSALNSIIQRASILPGGIALLLDENGAILAVSDESRLDSYQLSADTLQKALAENQTYFLTDQKQQMLLNSCQIDETGWTLLSVIPYHEMLQTSLTTRNFMLVLMLLISILFFILACFVTGTITNRITFLSNYMQKTPLDRSSALPAADGKDEISILINSYNQMVQKINDYADSQYQLGIALKSSELKALQAQINPHFLYNTLDLLNWIAQDYGANEISEVVTLLSRYYKLSLNKGQETVSVKDALKHIEIYIKLQNFRFGDSILLDIQVQPEAESLSLPNLLLQPIVENSVLHGILEKEEPKGMISIVVRLENDCLKLRVSDDGIGMTSQQIEALTSPSEDRQDRPGHFGIKNVIDRIQLSYGAEYGLHYESTPGAGTVVDITIPSVPGTGL